MDALKFLKERKRMCNSYKLCTGCPLKEEHCIISSSTSDEDYERMIKVVAQWSKEHPCKTRQSVFLEQWPDAEIDSQGAPKIYSCYLDKTLRKRGCNSDCEKCRHEFWMQEVEQ